MFSINKAQTRIHIHTCVLWCPTHTHTATNTRTWAHKIMSVDMRTQCICVINHSFFLLSFVHWNLIAIHLRRMPQRKSTFMLQTFQRSSIHNIYFAVEKAVRRVVYMAKNTDAQPQHTPNFVAWITWNEFYLTFRFIADENLLATICYDFFMFWWSHKSNALHNSGTIQLDVHDIWPLQRSPNIANYSVTHNHTQWLQFHFDIQETERNDSRN